MILISLTLTACSMFNLGTSEPVADEVEESDTDTDTDTDTDSGIEDSGDSGDTGTIPVPLSCSQVLFVAPASWGGTVTATCEAAPSPWGGLKVQAGNGTDYAFENAYSLGQRCIGVGNWWQDVDGDGNVDRAVDLRLRPDPVAWEGWVEADPVGFTRTAAPVTYGGCDGWIVE